MTDAVEGVGQDVEEEPADELVGGECHALVAGAATVAFLSRFTSSPQSLQAC
jgi:hypothetical protein